MIHTDLEFGPNRIVDTVCKYELAFSRPVHIPLKEIVAHLKHEFHHDLHIETIQRGQIRRINAWHLNVRDDLIHPTFEPLLCTLKLYLAYR